MPYLNVNRSIRFKQLRHTHRADNSLILGSSSSKFACAVVVSCTTNSLVLFGCSALDLCLQPLRKPLLLPPRRWSRGCDVQTCSKGFRGDCHPLRGRRSGSHTRRWVLWHPVHWLVSAPAHRCPMLPKGPRSRNCHASCSSKAGPCTP